MCRMKGTADLVRRAALRPAFPAMILDLWLLCDHKSKITAKRGGCSGDKQRPFDTQLHCLKNELGAQCVRDSRRQLAAVVAVAAERYCPRRASYGDVAKFPAGSLPTLAFAHRIERVNEDAIEVDGRVQPFPRERGSSPIRPATRPTSGTCPRKAATSPLRVPSSRSALD
jgi:hypothetical protein